VLLRYAGVAQLVEQLICNQPVAGSTPVASSIFTVHVLIDQQAGIPERPDQE